MIKTLIILFHVIDYCIIAAQNPQCMEKSFEITLNPNLTDLNSKSITIFYTITISKDIQAKNATDYVSRCVKSIIFKYRPINSNMNTILIEKPFDNNLNSSFTLSNLTFLTMYMIDISFRQVVQYTNCEITMELEKMKNIFLNTCFGRPSIPLNLKTSLSISGQVFNSSFIQSQTNFKLTWDQPEELNSPSLGYYQIVLADFALGNLTVVQVTQSEFNFLASNNVSFYVAAVNDAACFIDTSPFVSNCNNNKQMSQYSRFTYEKNPNDFYSFGQVDSLDLVGLAELLASRTTTTTTTPTTTTVTISTSMIDITSTTAMTSRPFSSNTTSNITELTTAAGGGGGGGGGQTKQNSTLKPNTLSKSHMNRVDLVTFHFVILILILFRF
jgi:hypothetical protein